MENGFDEPGAVSPLDRDPAVFVSTFRSYEELGLAYGKAALPKAIAEVNTLLAKASTVSAALKTADITLNVPATIP